MTGVVDLYDIALLINYERGTTEPRFRHAKLREIVRKNDQFKTILMFPDQPWFQYQGKEKVAFVFDRTTPKDETERDTPQNILPNPIPADDLNLKGLTPKELETIFWQVRAHDACYASVGILQHFFDLYPPDTKLRVRTGTGEEYITTISTRVILELQLIEPITMTYGIVMPENKAYVTGGQPNMEHAVFGFARSTDGNIDTILDLASMQFGDAGRGLGGKSLFAVENMDRFYDRIEKIARGADTENARTSQVIIPSQDKAFETRLRDIAKKVKQRWEKRALEHWCGHCGAPVEKLRCSLCQVAFYCDKDHQVAAWPFHKRFCIARK